MSKSSLVSRLQNALAAVFPSRIDGQEPIAEAAAKPIVVRLQAPAGSADRGRFERFAVGAIHDLHKDAGLGCETIDDVWFRTPQGVALGYVQRLSLRGTCCVVGHFAVARGHERQGVGRALARRLFLELHRRHRVDEVLFAEDHTRYEEAGYPAFFAALGATRVPGGPGHREAWLWRLPPDLEQHQSGT